MPRARLDPPAVSTADDQRRPGFRPGQSGNPAGRPRGSRHKAYLALDAIGTDAVEDIVRDVVRQALDGDLTAARIILDRVWPAPKGRMVPIRLPEISGTDDLALAHSAVLKAVEAGIITLDEAATLVGLLETRRRLIETTDIERRVAELERRTTET